MSAYYPKDRAILLFGGVNNSTMFNDTWEFHAGTWTQLTPPASPSPRWGAMMVYDARDGYVVLWGGNSNWPSWSYPLSDTWVFSNGTWKNISRSAGGPPLAGSFPAAAYDAADRYVVMFGGWAELGETWTFSAGKWSQLTPSNPPAGVFGAGMAYDARSNSSILYGGEYYSVVYNQTWSYHRGVWTRIYGNAIHRLFYQGLTYQSNGGYVLMFGGLGNGCPTSETWEFASGIWTQVTPRHYPSARYGETLSYDPADGYSVLFGGSGTCTWLSNLTPHSDTWTWSHGIWTRI